MNLSVGPYARIEARLNRGRSRLPEPGADLAKLALVYPGKSAGEIASIRRDTRECRPTDPLVIHPPPFTSRHVNIAPEGYRLIDGQMAFSHDPEHRNVFVFGGSTAWGYGLPDGETIASHLQRHLNREAGFPAHRVFNYGVCASYSKHERLLLERLIAAGKKPDHVVFIDGLNEFCRIPLNRPREDLPQRIVTQRLVFRWIVAPALFWRDRIVGRPLPGKDPTVAYDESDIERAAREFSDNWTRIRELCDAHGIGCTLALQPIPVYGYPLEENPFLSEDDLRGAKSYYLAARRGYGMLREEGRLRELEFLDLHGLRCAGPEYLDTCHYTSDFASEIARVLAERILSTRSAANPT